MMPYSKPRVVPIIPGFGNHVEWFVVTDCCPIAPGEEPPDDYCVWDWHFPELGEAMDAALAHVREHHEPKAPKASPKESVIRLEPAVKDQLQEVLDRFRIPYREHHDDGGVAYKNYAVVDPVALTAGCKPHQPFIDAIRNYRPDFDPSSEDWRELLTTSREDC